MSTESSPLQRSFPMGFSLHEKLCLHAAARHQLSSRGQADLLIQIDDDVSCAQKRITILISWTGRSESLEKALYENASLVQYKQHHVLPSRILADQRPSLSLPTSRTQLLVRCCYPPPIHPANDYVLYTRSSNTRIEVHMQYCPSPSIHPLHQLCVPTIQRRVHSRPAVCSPTLHFDETTATQIRRISISENQVYTLQNSPLTFSFWLSLCVSPFRWLGPAILVYSI